jgi:hypothetical protein
LTLQRYCTDRHRRRTAHTRLAARQHSDAVGCHVADRFIEHYFQNCKQFIFALAVKASVRQRKETELRHASQENDTAARGA